MAEIVLKQATAKVRAIPAVHEPNDVRPELAGKPDVAAVQDVLVQRQQPVGVVVEQHLRAAEER